MSLPCSSSSRLELNESLIAVVVDRRRQSQNAQITGMWMAFDEHMHLYSGTDLFQQNEFRVAESRATLDGYVCSLTQRCFDLIVQVDYIS